LPGSSWYSFVKIATDFALSLTLLVLAAPVLLLAVVLVKLTSRGPAFYSQTRLGRYGKPYRIYKIRSMYHNCERRAGPQWATARDPRITPVGRFLRATHLDELPQLWNVLRGDMSLVGPRPERPEIAAALDRAIPHYSGRLLVRPGLGGLAQVQLPPDTDLASVRLKLAYDLYYVQHISLWLDLRVALATGLYLLRVPFSVARRLLHIPTGEPVERPYQNWLRLGEKVDHAGWQGALDQQKPARQTEPTGNYDLDLSRMEEVELEVLARECGYHPAANELVLRRVSLSLESA
jgi:lipopolysaccharide/colanic/teichoic acid biosynthesis glycosyltransferase